MSTYEEDEETGEVASSRGEKKPKHKDIFPEGQLIIKMQPVTMRKKLVRISDRSFK